MKYNMYYAMLMLTWLMVIDSGSTPGKNRSRATSAAGLSASRGI